MIKFGTILKPVGLQGEVRVFSDSDFVQERLVKGQQFHVGSQVLTVSKAISSGHVHKIKFKEINSIEEAEQYRQQDLMVDSNQQDLLEEDEYFHHDLVGCEIIEDEVIGQVIEVMDGTVHPILRIQTKTSSFLLPFVSAFIQDVDIKNKRIVVKLIEGMYEN